MAATIDGHVAHPTDAWEFGSNEDRRRMDRLREWSDCLIVSRKTLEHDNMDLRVRTKPHSKHHPRPVIVAREAKPFRAGLRATRHAAAAQGGEVWFEKGTEANLAALWPDLGAKWDIYFYESVADIVSSLSERGYKKLLLEGGPTLNGLFFSAALVDEFFLTLLPLLWGGKTTNRSVITATPLPMQHFRLRSAEKRGDEMFLRYVRKKRQT